MYTLKHHGVFVGNYKNLEEVSNELTAFEGYPITINSLDLGNELKEKGYELKAVS